MWLWAALSALLIGFLFAGAVRVDAGSWTGRRMSPARIWSRFADYLADIGASPGWVLAVTAAMVIAITGSVLLVYLAFGLNDCPDDQPGHDREQL